MTKNTGLRYEFSKNRALFFMAAPAMLLVLVLAYIPLAGFILAFKNYRFDLGIFGSHWHKPLYENFRYLFQSGTGLLITRNTFLFNLLNLITSQILAVIVAVFITELPGKYYKRFCQSIIFLPYFISWVIVGTFVFNIFNYETGVLNSILKSIDANPVNLYSKPSVWPFIICAFNSWKWVGYGSIVYIASITAIDAECFEAADIDGANIFQKIWQITFPFIRPTIIIVLLLNVGRILRGDFQMFYQIVGNNGQLFNATDVIDTYVFRSLITNVNIGMTAAATLYQSVLCFIIIITVNQIVKKIEADYSLF
ncbi:MAG: ABC transporter permease subunit [Treponema sp.]|nr:ABC transporter permease subunit [Treponema sp.]